MREMFRARVAGIFAAAILASFLLAIAQDGPRLARADDGLGARIDSIVRRYVSRRQFNGAVQVSRKGEILFSRTYGKASLASGEGVSDSTRFVLASVTKPFTATLVLQQIDRGKLSLKDKVRDLLPGAPARWSGITIEHLLTHTAGLVDYLNTPSILEPIRNLKLAPDQIIARFSGKPLEYEPGTKLDYTNSGYLLLARILEKATGLTYERLLQENILGPLGMADTGIKTARTFGRGFAVPYAARASGLAPVQLMHPSILFGVGDIFSSARDLHKFDQALYGDRLLSRAIKEQMFTPRFDRYGLGFSIRRPAGRRLAFHEGHVAGFTNRLARYLDDEVSVILLCNIRRAPITALSDAIAAVLFGDSPASLEAGGPFPGPGEELSPDLDPHVD